MQAWIEFVPAALIAMTLLVVPGAILAWVAGARGFLVLGLAAPLTYAVVGGGSLVGGVLGLRWGFVTLVPAMLLGVGLAWLARLLGGVPDRDAATVRLPLRAGVVGVALGGLIGCAVIVAMAGSPDAFADRFDNVFHMNAIRYVLETQNASPLHVEGVASPGSPSFYPSVFHAIASLVAGWAHVGVPTAITATNMAIVTWAWVGGAVLLGQLTVPESRWLGGVVGGVLAAIVPGFPYLLMEWGILYPNLASFAVLPAIVALVLMWNAFGTGQGPQVPTRWLALIALPMVGGMTLAHPSGLLVATLVLAVATVAAAVARVRAGWATRGTAAVVVAVLVVFAVVWLLVRPPLNVANWFPYLTLSQAVGEALTGGYLGRPMPFLLLVATVAGAVVSVRRHEYTLVGLWLATATLFVVSAGMYRTDIRELVVGGFYVDNHRVAAVAAVGAVPLAIVGATHLVRGLHNLLTATRRRLHVPHVIGTVVVGGLSFILVAESVLSGGALRFGIDATREYYELRPDVELLDQDELTLIESLPELVPADSLILGKPQRGAAYVYALTGLDVGAAHMFYTPVPPVEVLETKLRRARTGTAARNDVCRAMQDLDVPVYVLDFDDSSKATREDLAADPQKGLTGLEAPIVETVAVEGEARLLRVTACDA